MSSINVNSLDLRQDTSEGKFYFHMKGQEEAYLRYTLHTENSPNVVEFTEMHVPEVLDGIGLENELAQRGIEYVDKNGYKLVPTAPYLQGFMNRHPEYEYLRSGSNEGKSRKKK